MLTSTAPACGRFSLEHSDRRIGRLRYNVRLRRTKKKAGISGAKGRDKRPGLDLMLTDASRRKFDVVMSWAIDRLGRSLIDLLGTIQHHLFCDVDPLGAIHH